MKTSLVLFVALAVMSSLAVAGDGEPSTKFRITGKRADDAVVVLDNKDGTVLDVKSRSGIGQAVIERTEGDLRDVLGESHFSCRLEPKL